MSLSAFMRFAVLCMLVLVLGGCNSTIQKYDSTFTSVAPTNSSTGLNAASSNVAAFQKRLKPVAKRNKPYFIEFRARNALTYGHASVVFGKLDRNGKLPVDRNGVLNPKMVQISGLHPATPSNVPWTVGHVVPVPAETGPSDGDFEDKYVTARYQINLTEREFRKVVSIVNKHKRQNKFWYAPLMAANCLGYIGSIAKDMGLKVPPIPELPKDYVNSLGQ